jgi:hypothetical protein
VVVMRGRGVKGSLGLGVESVGLSSEDGGLGAKHIGRRSTFEGWDERREEFVKRPI